LIKESISASIYFLCSATITMIYFSLFFLDCKPSDVYILFHDAHVMVLGRVNTLINRGEVGYEEL
jgi:hypothetical protein